MGHSIRQSVVPFRAGGKNKKRVREKAKLPGTCLFVDDKNHRERERERMGAHLARRRSRWMDWEMFCCYSGSGGPTLSTQTSASALAFSKIVSHDHFNIGMKCYLNPDITTRADFER